MASPPISLTSGQAAEVLRDCISVFIEPVHISRIKGTVDEAAGDPLKKMQLMMPLITSLLEQGLHTYGIANVMQALMLIHIHAGANKTIADAVTLLQNGASGDVAPAEDIKALVAKLEEEAG